MSPHPQVFMTWCLRSGTVLLWAGKTMVTCMGHVILIVQHSQGPQWGRTYVDTLSKFKTCIQQVCPIREIYEASLFHDIASLTTLSPEPCPIRLSSVWSFEGSTAETIIRRMMTHWRPFQSVNTWPLFNTGRKLWRKLVTTLKSNYFFSNVMAMYGAVFPCVL